MNRFCLDRARRDKFPVLCPTRYPRTSQSEVTPSGSSLLGSSFYWASFNDAAGFGNGDNGHLVFGGQRPLFSLAGSPGQTWPRPGEARPVKQLNLPRLLMTPMQDGRPVRRSKTRTDTAARDGPSDDRRSSLWPRLTRSAALWVDTCSSCGTGSSTATCCRSTSTAHRMVAPIRLPTGSTAALQVASSFAPTTS